MARSKHPWRQVLAYDKFCPRYAARGSNRVILTLSCGHTVRRKGSQVHDIETRSSAMWIRCPECKEEQ